MHTIFSSEGGLLDQALPEIFENKTVSKPRQDSVSYLFTQQMFEKPGYCYTASYTLDLKKPKLKKLINDPWKQWRHLKNSLTGKMNTYKFRTVMVPEKQENGNIHCHGIIRFQHDNYFDMDIARARLMKHMSKTCGRNLQWTRINSSTQPYMPTESNKKITAKQTLKTWQEYMHSQLERKWLGILDTESNL